MDLVRGDEQLLAALLDGDALARAAVALAAHLLEHLGDGLVEAVCLDGLDQVVRRVDVEGLHGVLAVGGDKDHVRRVLEMGEGLCELQAVCAGHVHVEEHDVCTEVLELLDGLANVGGLCYDVDLAGLVQKEPEFRAGRRLVIDDDRTQHIRLHSSFHTYSR